MDNVAVENNYIEGCDSYGILMSVWARKCVVRDNTIINANLLNTASESAIVLEASFHHTIGSITKSGTTCTWSYPGATLNQGSTEVYMAGQTVVISDSATPGNNGSFTITSVSYVNPNSIITYENASGANDASGTVVAKIEGVTDCLFLDNFAVNTTSTYDVGQTGNAAYMFRDLATLTAGGNTRNIFKGNTSRGMTVSQFNQYNPLSFYAENSNNESSPVKAIAGTPVDGDFFATPAAGTLAINSTTGELALRGSASWNYVAGVNKALSADFTTTLDTAVATTLSFPMKSGESWQFEIKAIAGCSGAGGSKYQFTAPGGSTVDSFIESAQTITSVFRQRLATINALNASAMHASAGVVAPDKVWGVITAGADGDFVLAVASVTAGQTTTLYARSSIRARRVTLV